MAIFYYRYADVQSVSGSNPAGASYRSGWARWCSGFMLGTMLILAGCAGSPPVRYYTLVAPAPSALTPHSLARDVMVEVAPVNVPAQVDQPQIMLRDVTGHVVPYHSDRWTSPLSDEVQAALSDGLTRRLGVIDVRGIKPASGQPIWRVQVDVQRFDSLENIAAVLDATWRLRAHNIAQAPTSVCRTQIRVDTAQAGVAGLTMAHQEALQRLSEAIANRLRGLDTAPVGVVQQCQTALADNA